MRSKARCARVCNGIHAVNVGYMDYGPTVCVYESKRSIDSYRKEAITAAKELLYGNECVDALHKATTETQIVAIMRHARSVKFA